MEARVLEMLDLQDKMNSLASGDDWRSGMTNKGKVINWRRTVYMELAEAIDSLPWKHWKNIDGNIDYDNFKIEMIDIWHFVMSELMKYYDKNTVTKLILENSNHRSAIKMPIDWKIENNAQLDEIIAPFEELLRISLQSENSEEYFTAFLKQFFISLDSASISLDELYELYIWKNVLNCFRQDNGYKEGTYIKMWNGEEDNVVMQRVLANTQNIGFQSIYDGLTAAYKEIK